MNIIETLDDPNLFAPHFRGETWTAWRSYLKALFAIEMDEAEQAIYRECTGRSELPLEPFRQTALSIGRRGGKSRMLATTAIYLAVFRNYIPHLGPGERATIAVIASDRRQARSIFRFCLGLLKETPMLACMVQDENAESINLDNRVTIEIGTASLRSTRGYSYAAVLADEIAFWRSEDSANPDQEIIAAIRPGLSTIPGSVLLLASSPYRKRGVLYQTYTKHYGKNDSRVLVWKAPTLTMNPALDPAIVEQAYEDDPEGASSEYGAEFRSDLSDYVPREVVDACTPPGLFEIPPVSGTHYSAFIDPSGGTGSDSMTLAISHRERDLIILDAVRERRPPFSPADVTAEFAAVLQSYRIASVKGDRWGGDWVREPFQKLGIRYDLCDQPKSDIYQATLPLLNSGRAQLLALPRLISQLTGLERRTSRAGKDSIDHAPGAHDDIANVVCGALQMSNGRQPIVFTAEMLARI